MPLLQTIITEKKAVIPDEDVKERAWILLFRYNPDLQVLVVRDADKRWTLPGGQLDNGESPEDAAYRELKEETGVTAKSLKFLKTIYHDKPNKLKVSSVFYTEVPKDTKIRAGDDAEKAKWLSPSEAKKLSDLSEPKIEAIKLAAEKIYDSGKELKETILLARSMGLPIQLLTESKKRKTSKGYLIVFEGIDGAGKTTQRKKLKDWLEDKGWKVQVTKWGTSPDISKVLELGKKQKWLTPMLFCLIHASDMVWRYEHEIEPALEKGHVVICDRYCYTSYVRDQLRGIDTKILDGIYEDFREPNLVVHFKVNPRLAVERLLKGKGFRHYSSGQDIGYHKDIEKCALAYETKMAEKYDEILKKTKGYTSVNSERSIDEIFDEIKKFIHEKVKAVEKEPKKKLLETEKMGMSYRDMISEMYIPGFQLSEDEKTFRVPENFDRYNEGSGWQAYRGGNDWENGSTGVAVYLNPEGYNKEMARIWFEIKFPPELEEAVSSNHEYNTPQAQSVKKWGDRAARRWIRETARIHKDTKQLHGAHDGYNHEWVERKSWKECFIMALESERMRPFVKKFGVDRTKWVGMKRETLCEGGIPSKFWWMDPKGELIPVPGTGHDQKAAEILDQQFGYKVRYLSHAIEALFKHGYLRVAFVGMWGGYHIELNYNSSKPPTLEQWRQLKDLAVELGANDILDITSGKTVRIDESHMLFEDFHINKDWFIYEGSDTITAVFEDNSRQTFRLHYHDNRNEDRIKWKTKAARTWKKLAMEIRKNAGLSAGGNPIETPWQQCFSQALQDPKMKEYINDLRATPIFESFGWFPMYNIWLSPDGSPKKVGSHEKGAADILASKGKSVGTGYKEAYDQLYRMGYARVIVGDNAHPLIVDTGTDDIPRLTAAQRAWVSEKSYELGLNGEFSNAYGRTRNFGESLHEMTYDDLRSSMAKYRSASDIRNGERTGNDSRERGAKEVRAKSLRVISTVGKDGQEHDTSLFSYKTYHSNPDPRAAHQRWQGYIRFVENKQHEPVAPVQSESDVEVNCNCPDYRYVWAKANADNDAGVTGAEKPFKAQAGFHGGGNDNNNTYGKKIRNPENTPGLCKHLIALAKFLDTKTSPVAPVGSSGAAPDPVAPAKPKKPVNIFETMRNFAAANPTFDVPYED